MPRRSAAVILALGALAAAVPPVARAQATAPSDDLDRQVAVAYQNRDFPAAERLLRRRIEAFPGDATARYNLACVLARQGRAAEAVAALEDAAANGFEDAALLAADADLDPLRGDPRVAALLARLERRLDEAARAKSLTLREGKPTPFTLDGPAGSPRAAGEAALTSEGLRLRAVVEGPPPRGAARGWRVGDGLVVNVQRPAPEDAAAADRGEPTSAPARETGAGASAAPARETGPGAPPTSGARFYAWGFHLEGGRPRATLLAIDGQWRLQSHPAFAPRIESDAAAGRTVYDVRLPWPALGALRPLADRRIGLNVVVVAATPRGRAAASLVPDPEFDGELSAVRRFAPTTLELDGSTGRVVSVEIPARVVGARLEARIHAASPEAAVAQLDVAVLDGEGRRLAGRRRATQLRPGAQVIEERIALPREAMDTLTLRAVLEGALVWEETILRPDETLLPRAEAALAAPPTDDLRRRATLGGLRLAKETADAARRALGPRDDPAPLAAAMEAVRLALADLDRGPLTAPGLHAVALPSSRDGELRPLTVSVPERFDPAVPRDVIVALHGAGDDEVRTVARLAYEARGVAPLVVGPRGRNPVDRFLGPAEDDVLDALAFAKQICRPRRVYLYGFSMGGYAGWRLAFARPGLFDGAILEGAGPRDLYSSAPEANVAAMAEKTTPRTPFLVIHGAADAVVPVGPTDAWVEQLKRMGFDVTYVRREGGGHGDVDASAEIVAWLRARR